MEDTRPKRRTRPFVGRQAVVVDCVMCIWLYVSSTEFWISSRNCFETVFWQDEHKETVALFQSQLKEARRLIEDLESDKAMSVATMKQEFHDMLESKDSELMQLKHRLHNVESDNISLKEEIKNLIQKSKQKKCNLMSYVSIWFYIYR